MEKTRKKVYMKRFSSVQKLQAKTERGKCILSHPVIARCPFKVPSQVMFQSRSTEHTSHAQPSVVNSHRKRVQTIESFFASNRSQTELIREK